MSATEAETTVVAVPRKERKLKPARKQVKPGDVEKKEAPQTGKEYSTCSLHESLRRMLTLSKISGTISGLGATGRTATLSAHSRQCPVFVQADPPPTAKPSLRHAVASDGTPA